MLCTESRRWKVNLGRNDDYEHTHQQDNAYENL